MIKVYLGIPSLGMRSDAQGYVLRDLEAKYKDKITLVYPDKCVFRKPHDYARNCIVEDFLKSDCDILWFLDADVVPPLHVLDLITEHGDKWDLAGAPYPVFMTPGGYETPQVVYTVYNRDEKGFHAAAIPSEGTGFVDGIATGCQFVKRAVFEKMQKPYYAFKYHPETCEIIEGEDLGFCRKVSDLGFKFFTDFSMLCRHYKDGIDLVEVNNYAISYAQVQVAAYDQGIRQALAKRKLGLSRPKSGLIVP